VVVISSNAQFARVALPGPNGTHIPFVAKDDLPHSPLRQLLDART
jgi:hypothetical protein